MSNPATVSTTPVGDVEVSASPIAPRRWWTEDWLAVLLGFVVLATVLGLFHWKVVDLRNAVSAFRWTTDSQIASLTPGWIDALDVIARDAEAKRQQNVATLSKGLKEALLGKDRKAIETAAGKTKTVKKELGGIKGGASTVIHLDAVTGPFDFIAVVEGPTLDAVGRLVTDEIGAIDGVTRTTTCLAVAIG